MTIQELIEKAESAGACHPALEWLRKQKKNHKGAQWAWDNCPEDEWIEWYFGMFATAKRRAEYNKAVAPARAEYNKAIAPAQAEYDKAVAPARAEYNKACDDARAEYNKARAKVIRAAMPSPWLTS